MHHIGRLDFLEVLGRLEAGLSRSGTIDQSQCLVFDDGWAITFNEETCVRTRTNFPEDWYCAVRVKPLKDTLDAMSAEEIQVDVTGNKVHLRAGRTAVKLSTDEVKLEYQAVDSPDEWRDLPPDFKTAVQTVTPAAGTNTEEFVSVCCHIHPEHLECSDRRQLSRYSIALGFEEPLCVRATCLEKTVPLDVSRVGLTPNWVHFRNKTTVISVRRQLLDYPDLSAGLKFRGTPATLPKGAIEAGKVAKAFIKDTKENDKLLVQITPGTMTITGRGMWGEAVIPLDINYTGEPVTFRLPPDTLHRIVSSYNSCEIGQTRLRVDGDNWTYLVQLFKPDCVPDAVVQSDKETE